MTDFIVERLSMQDLIDQKKSLDSIKLDVNCFLVELTIVNFKLLHSNLIATPFKNCLKGLIVWRACNAVLNSSRQSQPESGSPNTSAQTTGCHLSMILR
jgi:hypothetical protein